MACPCVSFINMKGGVGKTTLAMQIALAADQQNYRVLAIDLDPQANLSQAILGISEYRDLLKHDKPTVSNIFEGYLPPTKKAGGPRPLDLKDVIIPGASNLRGSTLDLIPSRLELSYTLRNPAGKERKLAKAISKVAANYDLIVIDCAPTDSVLTDAAYFASRWVMIPIKPEFMATMGLPLLAKSLERFKADNEDQAIDILGIVFCHSSAYAKGPEGRQAIKEVREFSKAEGWRVFDNSVPYSASYPKSARERAAIGHTSYVQWSTTAAFNRFRDEVFAAIGLPVKP